MGFSRFNKNVLNVSALPDRVQNQAQTLKATFDQAGVDIKTALNALIAELETSTSAANIGADVQSVATKTVQAILTSFEEAIAERYTKTEAETLLAIETNNLVADVDVNLTTGVITIVKKDGTTETFDTAVEKVPAKFEIYQNGDTYALKITNVDGTSTQTDITNFMNIYNFNNNDNITFEVTGTGTQKTVTANIKANSIGLDKLSLSVVSTLEGYMASARDSANAAKTSETNARASELNALNAEASAQKSAEDAEYWARQAQTGGGGITEIPVATADTLGGIKVGEGLEITEDGVLSAVDGMVDIDDTPTEGSENVVTSGGVKAYVDERVKILEASADNVIDFNTLTDAGNYIIKNVNDGKGLTVNSGFVTAESANHDVSLEVLWSHNNDGSYTIFQNRRIRDNVIVYYSRSYQSKTDTWTAWTENKLSASYISGGLTKYAQGSFSNDSTSLKTISLSFTPKIVIVYSSSNNQHQTAISDGSGDANKIPRILTGAYKDSDYGCVITNGFTFKSVNTSTVKTLYYFAIG